MWRLCCSRSRHSWSTSWSAAVVGDRKPGHSPSRRDRAGQRGADVVAARPGRQPDRCRRRRGDRRRDRRLDRLYDRAPVRHAALRPARPAVPEALRSRTRRAGREVVQPLGSSGGLLRPLHRAAADICRAAGRRAEDALPALPGGQRFRRHLLGGRHHRTGLLRRNGRRTLAGAVLLDRRWSSPSCAVLTAAIVLRERTSRAIAELEAEHYRKTGTTAADAA